MIILNYVEFYFNSLSYFFTSTYFTLLFGKILLLYINIRKFLCLILSIYLSQVGTYILRINRIIFVVPIVHIITF